MAGEFRMPDPGEGVHEVEIVEVHVEPGQRVKEGDTLLSIETDKAAVDVPAPFDGEIEEIRVSAGDRIEVGDVLMTYGGGGEEGAPAEADREDEDTEETKPPEQGRAGTGEKRKKRAKKQDADRKHPDRKDTEKADERAAAKAEEKPGGRPPAGTGGAEPEAAGGSGPVPAAPSTRRLARELDVSLRAVEGSGPGGRVLAEDVRAAAESGSARRAGEAPAEEPGEAPAPTGPTERLPLRGPRRATARRMTQAWTTMPHVMHQELVDITDLEQFRRDNKQRVGEQGGSLSLTVLVAKVLASVLRAFPRFNASLDTERDEIVLKHYYNLGLAVDTEDGLLVPVLRDVDRKSLLEIAVEVPALAERARARELEPAEMQDSTFTITNPGTLGGVSFTPIINPPEAAILGLGAARLLPRVEGSLEDYRVTARLMLPVVLAFDHRLNDGADAARFVNLLAEALSDPEAFVLQL